MAIDKLGSVRADILMDYVSKFKLQNQVDNKFFEEMARKNIQKNKHHEAAIIIHRFKFQDRFDCQMIILKLIDMQRIEIVKQLVEDNMELKIFTINSLATNENCKHSANLIKLWKLEVNDFPLVKERLMKSSMRFYLSRYLYNKPGMDDYMSLDKIEDMFSGFKPMLGYLVEDLVFKGKENEAKGVMIRHGLDVEIREDARDRLMDVVYDPLKESQELDIFGPITEGPMLTLPPHVRVEMISTLEDI